MTLEHYYWQATRLISRAYAMRTACSGMLYTYVKPTLGTLSTEASCRALPALGDSARGFVVPTTLVILSFLTV